MRCPMCPDVKLEMTFRDGVEIDYCPDCRGIWLDRGELEKLLDRAEGEPALATTRREERARDRGEDTRRVDYHRDHDKGKKKRSSFLGDLFDF